MLGAQSVYHNPDATWAGDYFTKTASNRSTISFLIAFTVNKLFDEIDTADLSDLVKKLSLFYKPLWHYWPEIDRDEKINLPVNCLIDIRAEARLCRKMIDTNIPWLNDNSTWQTEMPKYTIQEANYFIELDKYFNIIDPSAIANFIEKNSFLFPLLIEAQNQIKKHFPDAPLKLDIIYDPEEPSATQLVVRVGVTMEPVEAVERLDALDNEWWLDNMFNAKNKLCINLEWI